MKLRTLGENAIVVAGLFFFGIVGGFLFQMLIEPATPVSSFVFPEGWSELAQQIDQAVADARIRTIVFGVAGGYIMGIIAGMALKEDEEE